MKTAYYSGLFVLLLVAAAVTGCFSPAAMQQLRAANQTYSLSPRFRLDRNWRIAIMPARHGEAEVDLVSDRASLLLMHPGCFTLIDRAEIGRILREQRLGGPRVLDPHALRRLGRLAGAEAVMTISVTELGHDRFFKDNPDQRDARLFVKIISVETAEALYHAEGHGSSFEGADAALGEALALALEPLIRPAEH